VIASIELQQLRCTFQSRFHSSRPYLWGVLLQVDDDTLASGALVAMVSFPPAPDGSFSEIAAAMHDGDSAPIPGPVARYAARFRSGQAHNDLILVVVLWDARDTPLHAVAKGYDAFLGEIRDAVADNLVALSTADDDQEKAIEETINKRVHDKVEAAIRGDLSDLDKAAFFTGLKSPDRLIDSKFRHVSLEAVDSVTPFTFTFKDELDELQLDAQQTVVADPCEDQAVRVRFAQQTIANIKGALKQLHNQPESPKTEAKIEQLEAELSTWNATLAQAQNDLAACRIANP
jgi:hypothetical protein